MLVRAAEKSLQGAIDQPRIDFRKIGIAAAESVHGAGRVVLDHGVGSRHKSMQQIAAFGRLEIDGEAALVAIEGWEEARAKADQPARRVTIRRLDLDHIGTEIGKDQACGRTHNSMAEFQHANAG